MNNGNAFVIFGITGDLAKRKLLPALYHLFKANQLAADFTVFGTTRRDTTVQDVCDYIRSTLKNNDETVDEDALSTLANQLQIVRMDITQRDDYQLLAKAITQAEQAVGKPINRQYYLAIPPEMFEAVVDGLGATGLQRSSDLYDTRLLIEKPFGHNTESAKQLIAHLEHIFDESQIYRVDHYLAKETAQNILTFRFDNPIFRSVWNNSIIDHIQITAAETIGIEGRVNFYDQTGALRDLIQSHLLQLLALTTMEEPTDRSAQAIHNAKVALLNDIEPIRADQVEDRTARGQYENYRTEVENPESYTESFAALQLSIDNDRWRGVPVLLRAGKAMAKKLTEINLVFRYPDHPHCINRLTICIQPNEGVELILRAKKPSFDTAVEDVKMDFDYAVSFDQRQPDAYERVLIDAIRGDKTLFTTDAEIIRSWQIIEAVIDEWGKNSHGLETYASGSWGPTSSDQLANTHDTMWQN